MSRSFKKNGYNTDNSRSKLMKRFANKRIRNMEDIPSGSAYKKATQSWDICDFKNRGDQSYEEAKAHYEHVASLEGDYPEWFRDKFSSFDDYWKYVQKVYFRK